MVLSSYLLLSSVEDFSIKKAIGLWNSSHSLLCSDLPRGLSQLQREGGSNPGPLPLST